MKYKVSIDVDYVQGHLRYGHYEGIVEANSEEELKDIINERDIIYSLTFVVDEFEVEDIGDLCEPEYELIEE